MLVNDQLFMAQLHNSSTDLTPASMGLVYFNSSTTFAKIYNGAAWKSLVDDSTAQTVSGKTFTGVVSATFAASGAIDWAAGNVSIGASIGANTMILGGDTSAISIPGSVSAGSLSADSLVTTDDAITINSDAAQSGADWKLRLLRNTSSMSAQANITFPAATGTLATLSGSEILINKTIDSASNTLSNIANASISTSAAIAYSKLNLSASVATGDLASGLLVPALKGGSGVSNSGTFTWGSSNITFTTSGATGVTLPATGTLATLAGSESLSSKTIVSALLTTNASLRAAATLSFYDSSNTHFSAFKAPSSLTADKTFTLPDGDGSSNQALSTDGLGTLIWQTVASASNATPSSAGLVSTTAQSFGGLKKFEGGMIQVGTIDTSDTDQTLTNTSSRHITYTGFTAARNVSLATTTVLAGEIWTICNTSTKELTLKSSNGDIIGSGLGVTPNTSWGIFNTGYMVVKALQNTPTTKSHWQVLDYYSEYTHSTTFIGNGSGSSAGASFDIAVKRRMNHVTLLFPSTIRVTTAGTSTGIDSTTALPSQYRPDSSGGSSFPAGVRQNAGDSSSLGVIRVTNSGASPGGITIWKDNAASAFSDGSNAGLSNNVAAYWPGAYDIIR